MRFISDQQTLQDLNLLGRHKPGSVYNLFNQVRTSGGEALLEAMFQVPLTDPEQINERSKVFRFVQDLQLLFPLGTQEFGEMENYLKSGSASSRLLNWVNILKMKFAANVLHDDAYAALLAGLKTAIAGLQACLEFAKGIKDCDGFPEMEKEVAAIKKLLTNPQITGLLSISDVSGSGVWKIAYYDHMLRHSLQPEVELLLRFMHKWDVYIAVAETARSRNFGYAKAFPARQRVLKVNNLKHPNLEKATGNDLHLGSGSNMLFLTGANMAGKSTLMKSLGIALYLAHMGFPVAAGEMEFSVKEGLYTSINVPDNIQLGYSHFYAEVLRVKQVAKEVSEGKNLLVIFDELFKGTNVKDAYDATLAVSKAYAQYQNCMFIISTHIIEVGDALRKEAEGLQFRYLPTVMDGNRPRYTYRLTEGITSDRQGMMIIENEGILDLLR